MANEPAPSKTAAAAHRFRWLFNHQNRVIGFTMPPVWSEQSKSMTPDSDVLTIIPGANLVEVERWEALKAADPADKKIKGTDRIAPGAGEIARLLRDKIPQTAHRNRDAERVGRPFLVEGPHVANKNAPLDGIAESDALTVAEELRDLGMILSLIKIEKRAAVNEALHRARDLIESGKITVAA